MRRRWAIVACWLAAAGPAQAGVFETLVMPGPVAKAHADIEGECAKCHEPFRAEAQRGLCLDCHDAVAADQRERAGYHGKHPVAAKAECRSCHGEHRGRDADVAGLDRAAFDHAMSDFALEGLHATVRCAACHAAGKPFRDAGRACGDCHGDADPHRGELGRDCAKCHDAGGWAGARFDHATTDFALAGRHAEVRCGACHAGGYASTPADCGSCHLVDDAHRGRYGTRCGDCHAAAGWKEAAFDHARDTRFALAGRHAEIACEGCHASGFEKALATDCASCHRADDVHEGRHGSRCGDCHGAAAWTPARFDHDVRTKFALAGAHRGLACESCHTRPAHEQALATTCISCHRDDDAHEGQQGESCERCHVAAGWREQVRFDHDLARFPLLGMHAVTACESCHTTAAHRGTATACSDCHRDDDAHGGAFGARCESCHNPNAWAAWRFDHAVQAHFALEGAHAELACASCHQPASEGGALRAIATDCGSCHEADDRHQGDLGRDCGRCHGQADWRDVRVR
ncbi:MAG: cytochrome C [Proteobacteria bacterium]|nr:MAG: cytochrome C [Pseudomonadota bacterium]